jgi:hypothetical protein
MKQTNIAFEKGQSSSSMPCDASRTFATRSAYISMIMLVAVLWMATRSYHGVVLDGEFYMVEALRSLDPSAFADDLYFQFGSQGQFTIYPKLYLPFLPILGVGGTGILFTLLGHALWLGGLILLVRGLLSHSTERWLAIVSAIALPATYAFFNYGEPFASARLFSEASTLIALSLFLRRRVVWSFIALLLAGLIHPLPALPGFAFVFVYMALQRPIWWLVMIGGALALFGLAIAHVPPFANLLVTYDPEWFSVVKIRDALCFLTQWPVDVYFQQLDTIALAVLAALFAEAEERRVIISALIVGLGGIIATYVGADLTRDVLVTGLQPWRAMWLVMVIANLYAGPLLLRFAFSGSLDLPKVGFLGALAIRILSQLYGLLIYAAAPLMFLVAIAVICRSTVRRRFTFIFRFLILLAMVFAVGATILVAAAFAKVLIYSSDRLLHPTLEFLVAVAALVTIAALFEKRSHPGSRPIFLVVSAVLLFSTSFLWDARSNWTKFVETSEPVPASLVSLVPKNTTVY